MNFRFARDTFYVESLNNSLLIFMDKRIVFTDEEYECRENLGVLHWNENVDRDYTSIKYGKSTSSPRPTTTEITSGKHL